MSGLTNDLVAAAWRDVRDRDLVAAVSELEAIGQVPSYTKRGCKAFCISFFARGERLWILRTKSQVVLAKLYTSGRVRDLLRLRGRVPSDVVPVADLPDDGLARVEHLRHPDVTAVKGRSV